MRRRSLEALASMLRAPPSPDAEYYSDTRSRDEALRRHEEDRQRMKIYKAKGVTLTLDGVEYDWNAINWNKKIGIPRREASPETYEATVTMKMSARGWGKLSERAFCGQCDKPWTDAHPSICEGRPTP